MKNRWPTTSLGELTAHRPICYGVLKPGERQSTGVPLIRITDITNDALDESDIYHITPALSAEFRRSVLEGDEVLLSIQGTIGRVAICPSHLKGGNISRTIALISPDKRLVRPFLRYWLMSLEGTFPTCGATRASLNIGALRELQAPVPALPEQQRIVGILDEAFDGIANAKANAEKNLQNARAIFDSHLQSVFSQRGDGWEQIRLGDMVERLTNGYVGPTRNIYRETGIPYLLARHVKKNRLRFDGKTFVSEAFNLKNRKSILKAGDVLLVQSGHIGQSAVVPPNHEGHNCHAMIVITPSASKLKGKFLSWFFESPLMERQFDEMRTGSTLKHLNCRDVIEVEIPTPPLATQDRIVAKLDSLKEETQHLESLYERKLAALEALKKSLLQKAFTGNL